MESLTAIINGFQLLIIVAKLLILDICWGPDYVSETYFTYAKDAVFVPFLLILHIFDKFIEFIISRPEMFLYKTYFKKFGKMYRKTLLIGSPFLSFLSYVFLLIKKFNFWSFMTNKRFGYIWYFPMWGTKFRNNFWLLTEESNLKIKHKFFTSNFLSDISGKLFPG